MQFHLTGPSQGSTQPIHSNLSQMVQVLSQALEKKDRYTSGHVERTACYAVMIARELDSVDDAGLERVRLAAILHDLGKIGIEDAILSKGTALDPLELESMREHPMLGFEILSRVEGFEKLDEHEEIADAIRFHHERWDGQGYPQQLAGEQIPRIARLIAVADAYDAMVSTRPVSPRNEPRARV